MPHCSDSSVSTDFLLVCVASRATEILSIPHSLTHPICANRKPIWLSVGMSCLNYPSFRAFSLRCRPFLKCILAIKKYDIIFFYSCEGFIISMKNSVSTIFFIFVFFFCYFIYFSTLCFLSFSFSFWNIYLLQTSGECEHFPILYNSLRLWSGLKIK